MDAVTAPIGPVLVLAGAGSGKTRVLTHRIEYLVKHCGVNPYNVLAITFTNKAANEMKTRLYESDCNAGFMHISTIHSFCASVLRREASILNKQTNFSIYSEDEKRSILKKVVKQMVADSDADLVDKVCDTLSYLKNEGSPVAGLSGEVNDQVVSDALSGDCADYLTETMDSVSDLADNKKYLSILAEYNKKMSENNALDFDDLLFYVHKLFSQFPEVLAKYQDRYQHVLIDEFQDTNKVQYQIFKMLASKSQSLFVVGDDDQSIYSWRGADVKHILDFPKDFPNTQKVMLEQNYRSTKRILDTANEIISANIKRFPKKLWTENSEGNKTQLFQAYDEADEAYHVAEVIQRGVSLGKKYSDYAVLMRINALSRSFEQQFMRYRIPFKVFGGFKFFERKEVKDALAYARLILNPYDNEAFLRAINVPVRRGIGETTLKKLDEVSQQLCIPLIGVVSDERNMIDVVSKATATKLHNFYQEIVSLMEVANKSNVAIFMHELLERLDFRGVYLANGEDDRAINIDELEQSAIEFQASFPQGTLQDYLQNVSLVADRVSDNVKDDNFVTVATIHAVKGLEFDTVFVVGLETGIFPSAKSTYSLDALEEENRVMYVAATRAKRDLHLTCSKSRFLYGSRKQQFPSSYFGKIKKLVTPTPKVSQSRLEDSKYVDNLNKFQPVQRPPVDKGKSSQDMAQFKVGQMVQHATFGKGMILRYDNGIADVIFTSVGKKTLNVKFAPIKPL